MRAPERLYKLHPGPLADASCYAWAVTRPNVVHMVVTVYPPGDGRCPKFSVDMDPDEARALARALVDAADQVEQAKKVEAQ